MAAVDAAPSVATGMSHVRTQAIRLFAVGFLVLFLELACIRWFPAHVLFLTFFTNAVLLACFLGMSVGCLASSRPQNYLLWTPVVLALAMGTAHGVEQLRSSLEPRLDMGRQDSAQHVFFGTEHPTKDVARFTVPVEIPGAVILR